MIKFIKENFNSNGGWVDYNTGNEIKFVARFKYSNRDRAGFISFLIKNFTVEEYFARIDAKEAPLPILESKGYVSATVKKILKEAGYEQTAAGKKAYLDAQVEKHFAAA